MHFERDLSRGVFPFPRFWIWVALFSTLATQVLGFDDRDFQCKPGQKLSSIQSSLSGPSKNTRKFYFKCSYFQNYREIKQQKCTLQQPLQCNNTFEGCPQGQWLGGLRSFDTGSAAKILLPYCCEAENVIIEECGTPELVNRDGKPINFTVRSNMLPNFDSCWLIREKNGRLRDTLLRFQRCRYRVVIDNGVSSNPSKRFQRNRGALNPVRIVPSGFSSSKATEKSAEARHLKAKKSNQPFDGDTQIKRSRPSTTKRKASSTDDDCNCPCPKTKPTCFNGLRPKEVRTLTIPRKGRCSSCSCIWQCRTTLVKWSNDDSSSIDRTFA